MIHAIEPETPATGRFVGKVIIVTGAASGIGLATARRLYDEGGLLVLADIDQARLDAAASLSAERVQGVRTDISSQAEADALIAIAIARFGRIDGLVNAAGIDQGGSITDFSVAEWHRTFRINVDGPYLLARAAIAHLIATRGSIVNVASVSGLGGDWSHLAYNAAKGAVVNFTRALALDHGAAGVRVNAVCPSLTMTPMTAALATRADLMAQFAERIPLGRGARPEEIASVIAFLLSDDAAFVSGVCLPVDGGLSASIGHPKLG
jgi:meso-butanediol dehydrogenase/(S,S)-butanediol dehydrogenase/diacetyl reductase